MSRGSDEGLQARRTTHATRYVARRVVLAAVVPALLATASLASAQRAAPIRFEPCGVAARLVECAHIAVPESADPAGSRMLLLRIVRIRQDRAAPARTATFVLPGGPGSAAPELARGDLSVYAAWAEHGDVVFMDQRGTEDGSPLRCQAGDADPFASIFPAESLSGCRDAAARLTDLAAYGTADAARDIEHARQVLGYRRINFVGLSYGTRLALTYMERYPDRVRAAVLDGVAPRELRAPLHYAADAEAALARLSELCLTDPQCRQLGDPLQRYRSIMSRLARAPATVTIERGAASPRRQVTLVPWTFAHAVRGILYGERAVELPRLLAHADSAGDLSAIARLHAQRATLVARNTSLGLHLAVLCAEDVATLTPREIAEAATKAVAGSYPVEQYVAACERWRAAPVNLPAVTPPLAQPMLLLSGALDPVTPPRWADVVRERAASARHVVFPYGGHAYPGPGLAACKNRLIGEFLRTARADRLDVRCAENGPRPVFPVSD